MSLDEKWLAAVIELAVRNVHEGGGPFAAVIIAADTLVSTGQNRVTRDNDPTAHAEVVAIRTACSARGDFSLAGATLYASCEPCPLCLAAALWARVDRVAYAADRHDAARGGFDDREFHDLFARDRATWPMRVEALAVPGSAEPFDTWLANPDRAEY
ncbi:MAG: nucleoside deaminase [Pseudonocardiaceae bacterium]